MNAIPENNEDIQVQKLEELREKVLRENKQHQINKIRQACNVPENLLKSKTFLNFRVNDGNKKAFDTFSVWEPTDTWGIMLQGNAGVGKSHLLYAFMNKCAEMQLAVFFMNCSDMFDMLKSGYTDNSFEEKMDRLKDVEVLVLDDIGVEKPSEWIEEKLFQLLNHRITNKLPTFLSTNCSQKDLKARLHERITSRIKEAAVVVTVDGSDMRNKIYESRLDIIKSRIDKLG